MARQDPWLAARMRADVQLRKGEKKIYDAVILAMTEWLDAARALILHQPLPDSLTASGCVEGPNNIARDAILWPSKQHALTAAADEPPDIDAGQASFIAWMRGLENHIEPVVEEAFGEAFAAQSRRADISPVHFQEQHMAEVHDRLVIWPEGAFEELRPELLEAMAQNEDTEKITDRIGRILDIDAPTRRIRADIADIDRELADPETAPEDIPWLKGRRRDAWNQHDESQLQWKWLARRIARTEIQGAVEGGSLAAAQAVEEAGGGAHYKRWLSTTDERTRRSHSVADGQIVRLAEPFTVGGFPLMHPAFPGGPAHEVINCRCTLLILDDHELQEALQGPWGGLGVGPGNARMGPDDAADVAVAIDRLKREQAGEVIEHTPIGVRTEPEATTTPTAPAVHEDDEPIVIRIGDDNDEDQHDDVDVPSDEPELAPDPEDVDAAPDTDEPGPDETVDEADAPTDAPEPDDQPAPQRVVQELHDDFSDWAQALTSLQEQALSQWETPEVRERIQAAVSSPEPVPEEIAPVTKLLDEAIAAGRTQRDVTVWQPVDDAVSTFGAPNADLEQLVDEQVQVPGYIEGTVAPEHARAQLPQRPHGGGPALVRLHVPEGTPAAWLPSVGTPDIAPPGALLLGAGTTLTVLAVTYGAPAPVVEAEIATQVPPAE